MCNKHANFVSRENNFHNFSREKYFFFLFLQVLINAMFDCIYNDLVSTNDIIEAF